MLFLALFDFVPNLAFLAGAIYLVRLARLARGNACASMAAAGVTLILLGGVLQATWKLLYATGAGDPRWMSHAQFVLLAPGFVGLLATATLLARPARRGRALPIAAIAPWKLPFLAVMVLAALAAYGLLASIAFRRHAPAAGVAFVIAFLGILAMGGMSGGEQTIGQQWMEEAVNAMGQMAFAAGSFFLYRDYREKGC